ncbi:hypothetical protein AB6A40_004825 [Gnathostoma spinigerum]|uniref:Uncharacterized protein n=1 Tax=Gnathostoma spinigerum TaxID=75299 RepID=A0ABD6EL27_9BILA
MAKGRKKLVPCCTEEFRDLQGDFLSQLVSKTNVWRRELKKRRIKCMQEICDKIEKHDARILDMKVDDFRRSFLGDNDDEFVDASQEVMADSSPAYDKTARSNFPKKQGRCLILETPKCSVRVPNIITPKVGPGYSDSVCRTLRQEEIAFSVNGTPVVANDDDITQANEIALLLKMNEECLTPETRQTIQGMRSVLHRQRNVNKL